MSRRQKTGGWGRCRRAENKQGKTIAKKEERGVGGGKVERDRTKRRRGSGRVIMKRRGVVRRKKNPINNPVQELWRCCPAEKCQNIRCTLPFSPYSLCPVEFFPRDNQLLPYQPFRTIIPSDLTHLFGAPSYSPRVLLVTGVGKPFPDERQLTYIPPFLTAKEITRLVSVSLVFLPLFAERTSASRATRRFHCTYTGHRMPQYRCVSVLSSGIFREGALRPAQGSTRHGSCNFLPSNVPSSGNSRSWE